MLECFARICMIESFAMQFLELKFFRTYCVQRFSIHTERDIYMYIVPTFKTVDT